MPRNDSRLAEQQHLSMLLEGLPDAAVIVDGDLNVLAWNQPYVNSVGMGNRRFHRQVSSPGVRCRDLYCLALCNEHCLAKRVLASTKPVRMDEIQGWTCQDESSTRDTLIVTAIPVPDARGNVTAVLEIYRDVTAEARIQNRYKILLENERLRAEHLEEQVQARTADLQASLKELRATRAQLIQSEKLSSLGRLVAGIAHEINNPVNFIFGNMDFLQSHVEAIRSVIAFYESTELSPSDRTRAEKLKTEVDFDYVCEDLDKLLNSIRLGAERTAAIVRDLRTVCHNSGEEMKAVSIPTCVERTLNLLGHKTRERIEVIKQFPQDVPCVWGNEGRLGQVFMNIIVNAVQAIPDRGKVTITVVEEDDGVMTRISDNGVGIAEDVQLRMFDPFFTTKPVGEGTGLGLSITYSIVDAHNGRIAVDSTLGTGTTISIWLPRTKTAIPETNDEATNNQKEFTGEAEGVQSLDAAPARTVATGAHESS